MEYVFVGGRPSSNLDYSYNSINLTKNLLISMIDVLNSGNSHSKAHSFFKALSEMNSAYRESINYNIFLDSGGYSIIVGDVRGSQTREFIERYVNRILEGKLIYDYVFSLDIPIFLNEPQYNTKDHIYQFNRNSLELTYFKARQDDILKNKLYFVWHFKIKEQYDIWSSLYEDLKLNDIVVNYAAGGMVGLRGITQIEFSPFIAPIFRCLYSYINSDMKHPFRFHALGVYIQHDRFFLWILEKLFKYYLNRDDVVITYDSVNYMRTAQLRSRDLDIFYFNKEDNKIELFKHINCPIDIRKFIYGTNVDIFNIEIENVKNNCKMNDVGAFVPLNIYSNLQLDEYFKYIIDKYDILNSFLSGNMINIFASLNNINPILFTPQRINSLKTNFRKLWNFHQWFIKSKKLDSLNELIYDFIKDINFPASLTDANKLTISNNHLDSVLI